MKKQTNSNILSKEFEFPGSQIQYIANLHFTIKNIKLKIKPNFEYSILENCYQEIEICPIFDLSEIMLSIGELKIHSISTINRKLDFVIIDDITLIIKFPNKILKGTCVTISIIYSAGYYSITDPNL